MSSGVGLGEQSGEALLHLFRAVLQFSLPGLEVACALGHELIEGQFVVVLFECIFEEA
jgi:hypothetical protein